LKFSIKLVLWTMVLMAFTLGLSGFYFVNYVFETSLAREIDQALDENSILRFAFETAALNIPAKYDLLQNSAVKEIGANLEKRGQGTTRFLRLSDENREILYSSEGFVEDKDLLASIEKQTRVYRVIHPDEHYYIQTGTEITALDRTLGCDGGLQGTDQRLLGVSESDAADSRGQLCDYVFYLYLAYETHTPFDKGCKEYDRWGLQLSGRAGEQR